MLMDLEMEEEATGPMNTWETFKRLEKARKWILFKKVPEGMQPFQYLILSPETDFRLFTTRTVEKMFLSH